MANQPVDGLMGGRFAPTVAGMALLYWDGTHYKTTYVGGTTQSQVVVAPLMCDVCAGALRGDKASWSILRQAQGRKLIRVTR